MKTELVVPTKEDFQRVQTGIIPQTITEAITMAKTLYASKMFPDLASAEQAVAKILAGAEYGVPPVQSLNAFHIVKGKIMCHYSLIASAVRRAGYDYRAIESSDKVATVAFYRKGEEIGRETVTIEQAKAMGTQNLSARAGTMLFARAMSQGARKYVPEAFNGAPIYVTEEQGDIEQGTSETLADKLSAEDIPDEFSPFEDATDDPALFDEVTE